MGEDDLGSAANDLVAASATLAIVIIPIAVFVLVLVRLRNAGPDCLRTDSGPVAANAPVVVVVLVVVIDLAIPTLVAVSVVVLTVAVGFACRSWKQQGESQDGGDNSRGNTGA